MELTRTDDALTLTHAPRPLNKPAAIAFCIFLCGAAIFGALRLNDGSMLSVLLIAGACILCIGGIWWTVTLKPLIDVTATFDLPARRVRVVTRRQRTADQAIDAPFDDVTDLRLLEQRSGSTLLHTLTLHLPGGRAVYLGGERTPAAMRASSSGLKQMVSVIRDRTGIGGPSPLPGAIAAAAGSMGMRRR